MMQIKYHQRYCSWSTAFRRVIKMHMFELESNMFLDHDPLAKKRGWQIDSKLQGGAPVR